jgi:hypothetical protein
MSFGMRFMKRLHLRRHRELGRAKYEAKQIRGEVLVTATGESPTPNYKVWLTTGPERSFPPILELWWMKPIGTQTQVLMPFSVHLTFDSSNQPIDTIQVRDADGIHEITVEQVLETDESGEPTEVPERVPANSFRLMLDKVPVSYATTSLIGVPILNVGDQQFMGDDLHVLDTAIGQQVTVILRQIPDLEVLTFTLIVPPVLLEGSKPAKVEIAAITSVHHTSIAGPPLGQNISYDLDMLPGIAESIVT